MGMFDQLGSAVGAVGGVLGQGLGGQATRLQPPPEQQLPILPPPDLIIEGMEKKGFFLSDEAKQALTDAYREAIIWQPVPQPITPQHDRGITWMQTQAPPTWVAINDVILADTTTITADITADITAGHASATITISADDGSES